MKVCKTAAWLAGAILTMGCAETVDPVKLPPPVAGLAHPAVARAGVPVVFDANPTRVAVVKDRPDLSARISNFRFATADGSPYTDQAGAQWSHTFAQPGTYDVTLRVWDDKGGTSAAESRLLVVADLADTCTSTASAACDSGVCGGGVCTKVACAGDVACDILANKARCVAGQCSIR
ncbi:MAG: PKD domain-containing protein [Deltaproteobacteria bacterium]|nr:PKD domain-containing protein [Deltaproteobacteria bacterium]